MSRSRRKVKPPRVPEPGCLICDPEARRQAGRELSERSDARFVEEQIAEGTMKKGSFWSFVVFVEGEEVPLPKHGQILEPGRNAFNAIVEDLDVFLWSLEKANVRIVQKYCLDEPVDNTGDVDAPTRLLAGPEVCLEAQEPSTTAPEEEIGSVETPGPSGGALFGIEDELESDEGGPSGSH